MAKEVFQQLPGGRALLCDPLGAMASHGDPIHAPNYRFDDDDYDDDDEDDGADDGCTKETCCKDSTVQMCPDHFQCNSGFKLKAEITMCLKAGCLDTF